MAIPLDLLLQDDRNVYELTTAIIRRAHQIGEIRRAFSSDEHGSIIEDGDKVVSQAIAEVLTDTVHFEITAN
jgi:DNA-directed RNA polymerase subunit K/omega